MRFIELRVGRAMFTAAMGQMRGWLDRQHCPDIRFETATEGGEILIRLEFPTQDMATAFQSEFGGALVSANVHPRADVTTKSLAR